MRIEDWLNPWLEQEKGKRVIMIYQSTQIPQKINYKERIGIEKIKVEGKSINVIEV